MRNVSAFIFRLTGRFFLRDRERESKSTMRPGWSDMAQCPWNLLSFYVCVFGSHRSWLSLQLQISALSVSGPQTGQRLCPIGQNQTLVMTLRLRLKTVQQWETKRKGKVYDLVRCKKALECTVCAISNTHTIWVLPKLWIIIAVQAGAVVQNRTVVGRVTRPKMMT